MQLDTPGHLALLQLRQSALTEPHIASAQTHTPRSNIPNLIYFPPSLSPLPLSIPLFPSTQNPYPPPFLAHSPQA